MQVNTTRSLAVKFPTRDVYVSLSDLVISVSGEDKPFTLRQVAGRGFYDIETVVAALREPTRSGSLATFKIGPLNYYASPNTALTVKGPPLSSFTGEVVRNALWETKLWIKAMTEKVFGLAGW